jgi:hypothetical protein
MRASKTPNGVVSDKNRDVGTNCEVKRFRLRNSSGGYDKREPMLDLESLKVEKDKKHGIEIRYHISSETKEVESTVLLIYSPYLLDAFRNVIVSYPTVAADFGTRLRWNSLLECFIIIGMN